jgi:lipoprotein-anchoring transpeptidase ErfK/SrfK
LTRAFRYAGVIAAASVLSSAGAAAASVSQEQGLVTLTAAHVAYAAPIETARRIRTVFGRRPITRVPTVLPVVQRAAHGWIEVRLPGRPNGALGWIRSADTLAGRTPWHLVVELGLRRLVVYRAGREVRAFPAVVGKPATPTPLGEFFVEEPVRLDADQVGAPYALALSARSNVLQEFDGGPGQIAVHGLANVGGTPGTATSHGCIRLTSAAMTWLVGRIGAGVPVSVIQR